MILVHLAAAQEAQHLHSLAEQSLRRAAALQAEHLGLESPELARTLHKHALVLEKLRRKDEGNRWNIRPVRSSHAKKDTN